MAIPKLTHDLENLQDRLAPKALFAGETFNGQPAVVVAQDEIVLAANKSNAIRVDPEFGVALSGKLSLSATPDQVSFGGGYWRFNPLLLACIPSTTPTPVPVLVKSQPELLQGKDLLDGAESYLMSFSDAR